MLQRGANPSLKNKKKLTFMEMSSTIPKKLYDHTNKILDEICTNHHNHNQNEKMMNDNLVKSFIDLKDDGMLCTILRKLSSKSTPTAVHPVAHVKDIWKSKESLEDSYYQLLVWETKCHDSSLEDLKKCCKEHINLDNAIFKEVHVCDACLVLFYYLSS